MAYVTSGTIAYINDEEYVISEVDNRPLRELAGNVDIVSEAAAKLLGGDYRTTVTGVGWAYKINFTHLATHKEAIDELDKAVGNRDYTDGKYLHDGESVTTSLDILNNRIFALSGVDVQYMEYLAQKAGLDKTTPISVSDPAYISNNNVNNGDPLETAIGKLDSALGLRTYTEKSYLINNTVLTSSINLLEMATTALATVGDATNSFGKFNSISAALSYAQAGGHIGTVAIKRGTHGLVPTLAIPSGVAIKGEGATTIAHTTSGTAALFIISGFNSVEGVRIDRGDTWNYTTISATSNHLRNSSIGIDKAGYFHLGVHNSTGGYLEYWKLKPVGDGSIFESAANYNKINIGASAAGTTPVVLQLTPWGEPYLFFIDSSNVLQWARMSKGTSPWAAGTTPVASGVTPTAFDVKLDKNGYIHAVYTVGTNVKYATNVNMRTADAAPFQAGTVEGTVTGDQLALAIDPFSLVHFVYRNSTNNLRYRSGYMDTNGSINGLSSVSTLDAGGAGDGGVAMDIDPTGRIHIVYKNSAGTALNYSYKDTTSSVFTDVVAFDGPLQFPNIVADVNTILHIVGYSPNTFSTYYIRSTDGGQTFENSAAWPGAFSIGTNTNCKVGLAIDSRDSSAMVSIQKGAPSVDTINVSSRPPLFQFNGFRNRIINIWIKGCRIGVTSAYTKIEGITAF